MGRTAGILVSLVLFVLAPSVQAQTPFSRWSAVVVAGDWHAHSGGPTEAFDNARRDVADTLAGLGFARTAIRQYSVRPERYPGQSPEPAEITAIHQGLKDSAQTARSGCLFYISSHGGPEGALLGEDLLRPSRLAALIDDACPARPAVVVISACFSGVFIPALQKPNRMILTAARPTGPRSAAARVIVIRSSTTASCLRPRGQGISSPLARRYRAVWPVRKRRSGQRPPPSPRSGSARPYVRSCRCTHSTGESPLNDRAAPVFARNSARRSLNAVRGALEVTGTPPALSRGRPLDVTPFVRLRPAGGLDRPSSSGRPRRGPGDHAAGRARRVSDLDRFCSARRRGAASLCQSEATRPPASTARGLRDASRHGTAGCACRHPPGPGGHGRRPARSGARSLR